MANPDIYVSLDKWYKASAVILNIKKGLNALEIFHTFEPVIGGFGRHWQECLNQSYSDSWFQGEIKGAFLPNLR